VRVAFSIPETERVEGCHDPACDLRVLSRLPLDLDLELLPAAGLLTLGLHSPNPLDLFCQLASKLLEADALFLECDVDVITAAMCGRKELSGNPFCGEPCDFRRLVFGKRAQ
jgi:hypothetical protein